MNCLLYIYLSRLCISVLMLSSTSHLKRSQSTRCRGEDPLCLHACCVYVPSSCIYFLYCIFILLHVVWLYRQEACMYSVHVYSPVLFCIVCTVPHMFGYLCGDIIYTNYVSCNKRHFNNISQNNSLLRIPTSIRSLCEL